MTSLRIFPRGLPRKNQGCMAGNRRLALLCLLAGLAAQTAVAASISSTDASGLNSLRCKLLASGGGSDCHTVFSNGAGIEAGGRHLLQQARSPAAQHRGYMRWVHGQMMIFAWVGLVPLGVWMAYSRKSMNSRLWFQVHRAVMITALLVDLASVGVVAAGLSMSDVKRERVVLVHVCVCISIQILIGVQVLLALLFRPAADSRFRQTFNVAHRWLGWLIALVALAQLGGGMLLGHRPVRDYWAVFGVLVFWYLALVTLDMWRYAMAPAPGQQHAAMKGGRGIGNGESELLERRQEPPRTAGDVPNVGGYRDAPEGAGLVAAAMGAGRRGAVDHRSAAV